MEYVKCITDLKITELPYSGDIMEFRDTCYRPYPLIEDNAYTASREPITAVFTSRYARVFRYVQMQLKPGYMGLLGTLPETVCNDLICVSPLVDETLGKYIKALEATLESEFSNRLYAQTVVLDRSMKDREKLAHAVQFLKQEIDNVNNLTLWGRIKAVFMPYKIYF